MKTNRITRRPWLLVAALLSTLLPLPVLADGGRGSQQADALWRSDLTATLTQAKKENKPVLLRFTASWCAPCRVMDSAVWSKADVRQVLERDYLAVEIDIDHPGAAKLARQYNANAVPTLVILSPDGKERNRANFMSREQTLGFLKKRDP